MEDRIERYFLKIDFNKEWTEVSRKEWIRAERAAGFRPKIPSTDSRYMDVFATGGFDGNNISGAITYNNQTPNY